MQIAHECPLILMTDSRGWTDYDYALAHLFRTNKQYYQHFVDSLQLNRHVILDNGIFETGEAMPMDEYSYWITQLQPTEYVIPDVLRDSKQTIENCERWMSTYAHQFSCITIGVVQGRNYDDIIWCYNKLAKLVDKVAFNYSFYERFIKIDNEYMSSRQQLLYMLDQDNILIDMPHHLLGCPAPQELQAYYGSSKLNQVIKSIDTSNPIVAGLNNIRYNMTGLNTKLQGKLVDYMDLPEITSEQYDTIRYNVSQFRKWCKGEMNS